MVNKVVDNKERLYWSLQIGGWLIYAAVQIIASILAAETGTISQTRISFLLYEAVLCLFITHLYRTYINQWKWLILGMPRLIPRVVVTTFVMGAVAYFLRIPMSFYLGIFNSKIVFSPLNILGQSLYYTIIFFLWSVFYFIYNYFERYNKSLKMEASIKEIELINLKSQLNPHFIFNALNSIRALVDENPDKSKMAINQLSNILRNSLVANKRGLTKFGDELKMVKDYLGLESIRFEERLKTEFDIDPLSKNFLVPPLMIQTLVENGIKHGISKLTEGGLIQVKTKVESDHLKIIIRNSGQYINGVKKKAGGVGLTNTSQRLKLIYGDEAHFAIRNENNNFVSTEVIIPHITKNESTNY